MRILGVDPGLIRTGYGLIEAVSTSRMKILEAGIIRTSSEDDISRRVVDIHKNLTDIIVKYKPRVMVLEKLYSHYKHPITSILMGHARGVICLGCGLHGVKLVSYPATRIKKSVTGNGAAGKHQVRGMVKTLLGLNSDPESFDVSDALAMAIGYVYIEGVERQNSSEL